MEITYELGYEQGYGLAKYDNESISGKSIPGKVLATAGEKLKIHLDIDETQDIEKAYWYTWMPQTGNLFYCMPKLGTKVHLYFSGRNEANAIATECVRTNGGKENEEMDDYQHRQFHTEYDKSVALSPKYLQFSGESEDGGNQMNLTDSTGIQLQSSRNISITGMGRISMQAKGVVSIKAGKSLTMSKLGENASITITGSEISKYAEKIYHNGSPNEEIIEDIEPPREGFPAALFMETVMAMLPASQAGEENKPEMLSILGMADIRISKF